MNELKAGDAIVFYDGNISGISLGKEYTIMDDNDSCGAYIIDDNCDMRFAILNDSESKFIVNGKDYNKETCVSPISTETYKYKIDIEGISIHGELTQSKLDSLLKVLFTKGE